MIENIDIGGFLMLCLVVKNYVVVIVVVDIVDYDMVFIELEEYGVIIFEMC